MNTPGVRPDSMIICASRNVQKISPSSSSSRRRAGGTQWQRMCSVIRKSGEKRNHTPKERLQRKSNDATMNLYGSWSDERAIADT
jgi:hypothetical protein